MARYGQARLCGTGSPLVERDDVSESPEARRMGRETSSQEARADVAGPTGTSSHPRSALVWPKTGASKEKGSHEIARDCWALALTTTRHPMNTADAILLMFARTLESVEGYTPDSWWHWTAFGPTSCRDASSTRGVHIRNDLSLKAYRALVCRGIS